MNKRVQPETYSIEETARIFGVARTTIARHVESGLIPAIRLGGRSLIPRAYVDRLFAEAGYPREGATLSDKGATS